MSPLPLVVTVLLIASSAQAAGEPNSTACGGDANVCKAPPAKPGPMSNNWGQADPAVLHNVFDKVVKGAQSEKWAQANQGFFSKLVGRDPSIEAKVDFSKDYLVLDSPAVATKDDKGEAVVKVGKSALDATQSEAEMAFLLGHELHHTLVQDRKKECLRAGVKQLGNANYVKYSPALKKYQVDLEHEADAWGQRYADKAHFSPWAAVDAINHVGDLAEALGADASADTDHASFAEREGQLKSYGKSEPFEAACPWSAK